MNPLISDADRDGHGVHVEHYEHDEFVRDVRGVIQEEVGAGLPALVVLNDAYYDSVPEEVEGVVPNDVYGEAALMVEEGVVDDDVLGVYGDFPQGLVHLGAISDVRVDVCDYDVPVVVDGLPNGVFYDFSDEAIPVLVTHDDPYGGSNNVANDVVSDEEGGVHDGGGHCDEEGAHCGGHCDEAIPKFPQEVAWA